ncbi:hypothetical protein ACLOJK_004032 [Asimina triloba]
MSNGGKAGGGGGVGLVVVVVVVVDGDVIVVVVVDGDVIVVVVVDGVGVAVIVAAGCCHWIFLCGDACDKLEEMACMTCRGEKLPNLVIVACQAPVHLVAREIGILHVVMHVIDWKLHVSRNGFYDMSNGEKAAKRCCCWWWLFVVMFVGGGDGGGSDGGGDGGGSDGGAVVVIVGRGGVVVGGDGGGGVVGGGAIVVVVGIAVGVGVVVDVIAAGVVIVATAVAARILRVMMHVIDWKLHDWGHLVEMACMTCQMVKKLPNLVVAAAVVVGVVVVVGGGGGGVVVVVPACLPAYLLLYWFAQSGIRGHECHAIEIIKVAIIKSDKDARYGLDSIVTHDGAKMPCWALHDLSSFKARCGAAEYEKLDVIGIDEGQFFEDLYSFCCKAADHDGKIVIVAGLDGDYLSWMTGCRRNFGSMLDIIPLANSVTKLTARCELCQKQAFFTLRKTDETQTELIGGADVYMPVCRQHYVNGQVVIEAARSVLDSQKAHYETHLESIQVPS